MNPGRMLLAAAAVLALSGCVSQAVRTPDAAVLSGAALVAATALVEAREARVRDASELAFSGRVALSNGSDGGNGRIDWAQSGAAYRVVLSAPVTRRSWSLSGDPEGARIEGLDGGPREGPDVERLLLEATGMQIPVGALAAWAAGTRADPGRFGDASLQFDAVGRLVRMEQDGWTIDYQRWPEPAANPDGSTGSDAPLPERITAQRGEARVRLIVDDWMLGGSSAAGG